MPQTFKESAKNTADITNVNKILKDLYDETFDGHVDLSRYTDKSALSYVLCQIIESRLQDFSSLLGYQKAIPTNIVRSFSEYIQPVHFAHLVTTNPDDIVMGRRGGSSFKAKVLQAKYQEALDDPIARTIILDSANAAALAIALDGSKKSDMPSTRLSTAAAIATARKVTADAPIPPAPAPSSGSDATAASMPSSAAAADVKSGAEAKRAAEPLKFSDTGATAAVTLGGNPKPSSEELPYELRDAIRSGEPGRVRTILDNVDFTKVTFKVMKEEINTSLKRHEDAARKAGGNPMTAIDQFSTITDILLEKLIAEVHKLAPAARSTIGGPSGQR